MESLLSSWEINMTELFYNKKHMHNVHCEDFLVSQVLCMQFCSTQVTMRLLSYVQLGI